MSLSDVTLEQILAEIQRRFPTGRVSYTINIDLGEAEEEEDDEEGLSLEFPQLGTYL